MGQIIKPINGNIYTVKIRDTGRVWIFESDYDNTINSYTQFKKAYCCDSNGNSLLQNRIIKKGGRIVSIDSSILWMRRANPQEITLFYLKLSNHE